MRKQTKSCSPLLDTNKSLNAHLRRLRSLVSRSRLLRFCPRRYLLLSLHTHSTLYRIASCLVYSLPYGGPVSMVWGWLVASILIMFVGLALAELASAAPTSGGLYFWTWAFSPPRYRKVLSWLVGCKKGLTIIRVFFNDTNCNTYRRKYSWIHCLCRFDRLGVCGTGYGGRDDWLWRKLCCNHRLAAYHCTLMTFSTHNTLLF